MQSRKTVRKEASATWRVLNNFIVAFLNPIGHNMQALFRSSVPSVYRQELKSQVCNGRVEGKVIVKV